MRVRQALALLALLAAAATALPGAAAPRVGDGGVFATVPYPGHPGGIVVDGDTMYVATFNPVFQPLDGYDAIFAFDLATGALRTDRPNPIKVPRRLPVAIMGFASIEVDAAGDLYVADMNGRVLRVDPMTGSHSDYAVLPTDTATSVTGMPGGMVFDDSGTLYVGDASAPVIWRVPPGGGVVERFLAAPFAVPGTWAYGMAGLAIDPTGTLLYFSASTGNTVAIYRVPLANPSPAAVERVHLFTPPAPNFSQETSTGGLFGAAGIAFGSSGKLYVTLLGANQVAVLRPDGTEEARFPDAAQRATLAAPYDEPLFTAFDGAGSLLVTNGSFRGPHSVVFEAWVGDVAHPLARPAIPVAPAPAAVTVPQSAGLPAYACSLLLG